MNEGLLIFGALSFLFIGMFAYAYGTEYFIRIKEQRLFKLQLENEVELFQHKILKDKLRQEKFLKFKQRSEEIKQEFKRLAEFRSKMLKSHNLEKNILA